MKKIIITGTAIIAVVILCFCVFTVDAKEYAIVTQFGKPVRIIKDPGLQFKLPGFLQTVHRLDKRISLVKTRPIQFLLGDKNPLIVTCYVCWRISDPLLFFQSLISRDVANQKINDMINSHLGSTLSDYTIDNIINTDSSRVKLDVIEGGITERAGLSAREKYGIEIVTVGIRRINYPKVVARSVYARMRAEREKEAKRFRAEGEEEASKIRAEADKEVARINSEAYKESEIVKGRGDKESMRIYAETYSKNPEFFEFVRSCDALKEILKKKGTLILSTDSELLKYLDREKLPSGGE